MKRRKAGRIAWGVAIAVLVFALAWFNWIEPAREKAAESAVARTEAEGTESTQVQSASEVAEAAGKESSAAAETNGTQSAAAAAEVTSAGALAEEAEGTVQAAAETTAISGQAAAETAATSEEQAAAETTAASGQAAAESAAASGSAATAGSGRIGSAVGDTLPDFETELLGGGSFHLADYRGQVVVINLWGTTCGPCIEELPYFEQLKVDRPEVEILAIHHRAGAKKAEDFLADKGWDHLDFALDSKEKGLYALLEAADAMPATIVLDKNGVVTYNVQAPLTYEQLDQLVTQAS